MGAVAVGKGAVSHISSLGDLGNDHLLTAGLVEDDSVEGLVHEGYGFGHATALAVTRAAARGGAGLVGGWFL